MKKATNETKRLMGIIVGLIVGVKMLTLSPSMLEWRRAEGGGRIETPGDSSACSNPQSTIHNPTSSEAVRARVSEAYGQLPLSFEANLGQTDEPVRFISRGDGYRLFLTPTEAALEWRLAGDKNPQSAIRNPQSAVVRMKLVGANPAPHITGVEELPGTVNYFIGDDSTRWRSDVPTYAKVKYEEVYPGVDLVYYGNQRQLEYDFVLAPGADPKAITLAFEGADKLEVDAVGDLVLHTAGQPVRWRKPVVYQEINGQRIEVTGGFKFLNPQSAIRNPQSMVGFELGDYDATRPLVIDPVLVYSTYFGGRDFESGGGGSIAVDGAGNMYVTGITQSSDFPTANPIQSLQPGGQDAFVAKLNPAGSALIYSTYLGGAVQDRGLDIAVDAAGNAYVTGRTGSDTFPLRNALQRRRAGVFDGFVTKLSPTGALLYSTFIGGVNGENEGFGIAVDTSGNAYITGRTTSMRFPTVNPLQATNGGGANDAFVAKINPTGSALIYSTYLGGNGAEFVIRIDVDTANNVYVIGSTDSTNFPTANPLQPTNGGGTLDAFVAKINPTGSALIYSTYLGGSGTDTGAGIDVDAANNVYVTGGTSSMDFPTVNPLQPTNVGDRDAFVAKINPTGSVLIYSTYLGGSMRDIGRGIAVDASGSVYVTGVTQSFNFPTSEPLQQTYGGGDGGFGGDAFVAKLDPTGSALVYSTYFGGSDDEDGQAIIVDSSGNAYVRGITQSPDFATMNPFQKTFGGFVDAFIAKIADR
jgi:hypothetical protein